MLPLLLCASAFGQLDPEEENRPTAPGGISKRDEQVKFHKPVKGMDDGLRMQGYQQRLELENASPFNALQWRNIGPTIQGGRVVTINAPKDHPEKVYTAFATGGLYRTEDDGITWTSLFEKEAAFGIGDFAISHDGKTIWIGSGEANAQRTSYAGAGMFKSIDEGKTWQRMGLEATQHIGKVLIDPRKEDTVWVAAAGHLYSQNPERGIYKTSDGGRTWKAVLQVENTGGIDLAMDPRDSNVVFAAMWERDRRAWNFLESGTGSALYKTTDGGRTWQKLSGLPTGFAAGRIGLAICPSKPSSVYAFFDNQEADERWLDRDERAPSGTLTPRRFTLLNEQTFVALDPKVIGAFLSKYGPTSMKSDDVIAQVKSGKMTLKDIREAILKKNPAALGDELAGAELYRSDDSGKTWHEVDTHFGDIGDYGYYFGKVFVNPRDDQDVFITSLPMIRSRDGGKTWKASSFVVHSDQHALWFDPRNPNRVWLGCDGGIYISNDWQNFRHIENMSVGQGTALAIDNDSPYNVYIGLQDNGTMKGPSTARRPADWTAIGGGDGAIVQVDPRSSETVYTSSQFGAVGAVNSATKSRWRLRPSARRTGADAPFNWITPFILSPFHPDILYMGADRLFRSFDQGRTWTALSGDLTKNLPNGDVPYSTIKDISESPLQFGLVYVGTDDGNVKMTPDGGMQWIDVPTPKPDKWVARVLASKWNADTVYCAQSGYREDDFQPYLWKSTDRGKNWTSIATGLPADECVNVVREDPNHEGILYVGTDMGVFVSYDKGSSWTALTGDLPHLPVHDLLVQPRDDDLVIATHARGAYILPLKLVYAMPENRKKDLVLEPLDPGRVMTGYEPLLAYGSERDLPVLKGQFWTLVRGPATIKIKDKSGTVVRETSQTAVNGYNYFAVDLTLAPRTIGGPIKADPSKPLEDPYASRRAKYLPAGEYTVEVTVGGKTVSQPWKIREPS